MHYFIKKRLYTLISFTTIRFLSSFVFWTFHSFISIKPTTNLPLSFFASSSSSSSSYQASLYKMLRSRFSIQPLTGVGSVTTADHTNATTSRSLSFDFSPLQLPPLRSRRCCFRKAKSILISCNSSRSRSSFGDLHNNNNNNNDFLEASLLLSGLLSFSLCSFSFFFSSTRMLYIFYNIPISVT